MVAVRSRAKPLQVRRRADPLALAAAAIPVGTASAPAPALNASGWGLRGPATARRVVLDLLRGARRDVVPRLARQLAVWLLRPRRDRSELLHLQG